MPYGAGERTRVPARMLTTLSRQIADNQAFANRLT